VGQGDVDDRHVDDLHDRREHDRDGDHAAVERRIRAARSVHRGSLADAASATRAGRNIVKNPGAGRS
jgi:hypothetical protein